MTPEDQIRKDLAHELMGNAKDFLNQGLAFLLEKEGSARAPKFAVVNLQMSMELLMKWFLVKTQGTQSIFRDDLTGAPDVRERIWAGQVFTKGYERLKRDFKAEYRKQFPIDRGDETVIDEFQNFRNRIVHSFMAVSYEDAVIRSAELVFKIMRRTIGEEPGAPFRGYLDPAMYDKLVRFEPYIERSQAEAERVSEEDVRMCWACANASMAVFDGSWFCFVCGESAPEDAVAYVECPSCTDIDFAYDLLNVKDCGTRGKCMQCGKSAWVESCIHCEAAVFTEHAEKVGAIKGPKGWYCSFCASLIDAE